MKLIGRLIALISGAFMLATFAGAFAAAAARRREPREATAADADEIHLSAALEPVLFESTATAFRGGTLDMLYGGGIIDLRKAVLDPAGATLRVRAVFGGAQVVVPEAWIVESRLRGIGGVGDGRPATERPQDAPVLRIEGFTLFGGFGVTSIVSEKALTELRAAVDRQAARRVSTPMSTPMPAAPEAG